MKVILAFLVLIVSVVSAVEENPDLLIEINERNPDNSYYFV